MTRQQVNSGGPWEARGGYSRAVRAGQLVFVAGTTAANADGTVHAPGDLYAQAMRSWEVVGRALVEVGSSLSDVVRTRMYVTDARRWEEALRAHGEVFGDVRPAASLVEVRALIHPDMLIEVEADAVIGE